MRFTAARVAECDGVLARQSAPRPCASMVCLISGSGIRKAAAMLGTGLLLRTVGGIEFGPPNAMSQ